MTPFGEKYFVKIGENRQFNRGRARSIRREREGAEGLVGRLSSRNEILMEDAVSDARDWEFFKGRPALAAQITFLKASRQNDVQSGAGDDAELAGLRNCAGEPPTGNSSAHASLND